ncbi:MAG: extracellular solute-binding protein [Alphaproteobacteria bacterium]|nr:extracellular solute-binding protein [Alphaproteobacteria bacterium]MBU0863483.1 extracellular solute-binding protein [Alphaproteobacteria bacterium]MBU1823355.1 extracellular solute-binding protein [Alphaproteobacteria bacterium]
MIRWLVALLIFAFAPPAAAQLHIYGPGGPAPAMRAAALAFEKETGIAVEVVAGPTPTWIDRARQDADLMFSGSDRMMTEFVRLMDGKLRQSDVVPLYDRPAAILVRKGNPMAISGFRDLARGDLKLMVVEGAGQDGLWEDLASRAGGIDFLRKLRGHIKAFAPNSAAARTAWIEDPAIDAWIIWNIWQLENADIADAVAIEPDVLIYRSMAIAPVATSLKSSEVQRFATWLAGPDAQSIFTRHGWRALSAENMKQRVQ